MYKIAHLLLQPTTSCQCCWNAVRCATTYVRNSCSGHQVNNGWLSGLFVRSTATVAREGPQPPMRGNCTPEKHHAKICVGITGPRRITTPCIVHSTVVPTLSECTSALNEVRHVLTQVLSTSVVFADSRAETPMVWTMCSMAAYHLPECKLANVDPFRTRMLPPMFT